MLLRSLLFVPGHRVDMHSRAAASDADILVLDVEDAVPTDSTKQLARHSISQSLANGLFHEKTVFCRINDRMSGHLHQDLIELARDGVAGFMYPKAQSAEDIFFVDQFLDSLENAADLVPKSLKLIPLIETCSAVENSRAICEASDRVVAIAFGAEDFITDLGVFGPQNSRATAFARARIACAAAAAKVAAIDTVYLQVHNLEGLAHSCRSGKDLGMRGKLVLHPKQVSVVNAAYSPSEQEVSAARRIIDLADKAQRSNRGVVLEDEMFVGPPFVQRAQDLLAMASAISADRR